MARWRRRAVVVLVAIGAVGLASAPSASEKWGPFRGQVVDLETGQPIAGAVVLAVWWKVLPGLAHGTQEFYDAKEAVTGPDGHFEIPRLSVPPWQLGVQPPTFHFFAPGYVPHADIVTPPGGEPLVDPTVTQMRRLKTREELLKKSRAGPAGVPLEKMAELTRAINVERDMLGLKPLPLGPMEGRQP